MHVGMRTNEEIAYQILQSAENGATQMTLMYDTYLSHDALKARLKSLTEDDLIEYVAGEMKYRTTGRGRAMLFVDTKTQTKCSHQCKRCGMIYLCGVAKCKNFFQHGICTGCDKSFGKAEGLGVIMAARLADEPLVP